jgi:hypothetical protein
MKTTLKFAVMAALSTGALFAETTVPVDCSKLSISLKEEISANQSLVLQIVERAVLTNPSCACEIVKASIQETKADSKLIASIVEVVGVAAPEQLRLAAQCAVAVAPDSLEDVQAVLAKLDPGTGDGVVESEKGGVDKGGIAKEKTPNPLDFPLADGPQGVGFSPNSPGGFGGPGGSGGPGGFGFFQPPSIGSNPGTNNDLPQP